MKGVTPPRGLRRRLAITFAGVAALSTGALAVGTYLVVAHARLDESRDAALAQARTNLVLAGAILEGSSTPQDVSDVLTAYSREPGFETVALAHGETYSLGATLSEDTIPAGVRRVARGGDLAYQRARIAGTPYLVAGGSPPPSLAELYFFFSERALRDDLAQLRDILVVGWLVVVTLSAAAGVLVARRVLAPIGRASEAAHALAEGLLETRLPVESDDEIGTWATSFNEMAEALEEKISALADARERERRFTADVAHELRTPLTALAGEAALLATQLERLPPDSRRPAELLVGDVRRLRRLVEELLEVSRLDAGREDVRVEPVALASLVSSVLRSRGWETAVSLDAPPIVVPTDPRRVERIVANLVDNALIHGGQGVAVRVGRNGAEALVEVADRGPGMTTEQLEHAFDRFYKADSARTGGGSGLGLAIALENARLIGGEIDAWSEPGAGSRFTLLLPVAQPLRDSARSEMSGRDDGS